MPLSLILPGDLDDLLSEIYPPEIEVNAEGLVIDEEIRKDILRLHQECELCHRYIKAKVFCEHCSQLSNEPDTLKYYLYRGMLYVRVISSRSIKKEVGPLLRSACPCNKDKFHPRVVFQRKTIEACNICKLLRKSAPTVSYKYTSSYNIPTIEDYSSSTFFYSNSSTT